MVTFKVISGFTAIVFGPIIVFASPEQNDTLQARASSANEIRVGAWQFAHLATKSTSAELPTVYFAAVTLQTQTEEGGISCSFATAPPTSAANLNKIFVNERMGPIAQTKWHQVIDSGVRYPNEFQAKWLLNPRFALASRSHPAKVKNFVAVNTQVFR